MVAEGESGGPVTVTLLLLEDQRGDLDLQRTFLGRHEVRILAEHPDGPVRERVLGARPDLVIADVEPPERQGLAVCRVLKEDPPGGRLVPVVCLIPRTLRADAEAAGADAVVFKPIVQREFVDTVRRFVPLVERRGPRCPVKLRFSFEGAGGAGQAFSRDLSARGVFLKSDRVLPPGQRLKLRFRLPGGEAEIACAGIIRSNDATGHGLPPGFGVEFLDLAAEDRARLEQFVGGFARRSQVPGSRG